MENIYSLLRNNKISGPYTLPQLLSLELTAADLIWEKDISAKWSLPNEIDSLKESIIINKYKADLNEAGVTYAEEVELIVKYNRSLEEIKSSYYLWKEKEQIKRSSLKFHFQTIPFIILFILFSVIIFKGTGKSTISKDRQTAFVQVSSSPKLPVHLP